MGSVGTRAVRVDKRRAILDAAAPVFGEQGFERSSIDAIATAAGVSKPTVYSHFGSKENLFRESVADSAARLNADSLEALHQFDLSPGTWRAGLDALALKIAECQRSSCSVYLSRMLAAEVGRDPAIYATVHERAARPIYDALAGRLAMIANAGHLRIADPELAARQFLALISAEMPELTHMGTHAPTDRDHRAAVLRGVATFAAAHARG